MCTGLELLFLGGTALSGYGAIQQGKTAQAVAESQAQLGEIAAQDALAVGSQNEARYRRDVAQVAGAQKAAFGARNVASSGTALDLLADTAGIGEEDALTIRNNAAREAYGLRAGAAMTRAAGRQARSNSYWQAGSTLLTGGAQAYSFWKKA